MQRCGRKTRNGEPCKLPAGFGTPFLGQADHPCKFHGGCTPSHLLATSKKLFPQVIDARLIDRAEAFANDPDILSLNREIGIARALLERLELESNPDVSFYNTLLRTIAILVEQHQAITERKKFYIRVDEMQSYIMRIIDILFANLELKTAEYLAGLIQNQLRTERIQLPGSAG